MKKNLFISMLILFFLSIPVFAVDDTIIFHNKTNDIVYVKLDYTFYKYKINNRSMREIREWELVSSGEQKIVLAPFEKRRYDLDCDSKQLNELNIKINKHTMRKEYDSDDILVFIEEPNWDF